MSGVGREELRLFKSELADKCWRDLFSRLRGRLDFLQNHADWEGWLEAWRDYSPERRD